jgi:methylated-DNA-[protein]-cysteine S-methyltransferase
MMSIVQHVKHPGYKDMESPVGQPRLITSAKDLSALIREGGDYQRANLIKPGRNDESPLLRLVERQLEEYFNYGRRVFDIPPDLDGTSFQKNVRTALLRVPSGETRSYGDLARELGDIETARAVGGALNKNPVAIVVPCHRIVGGSGKPVGFAGGLNNKAILPELESRHCAPGPFDQPY